MTVAVQSPLQGGIQAPITSSLPDDVRLESQPSSKGFPSYHFPLAPSIPTTRTQILGKAQVRASKRAEGKMSEMTELAPKTQALNVNVTVLGNRVSPDKTTLTETIPGTRLPEQTNLDQTPPDPTPTDRMTDSVTGPTIGPITDLTTGQTPEKLPTVEVATQVPPSAPTLSTIDLAAQDVRVVLQEQWEQSQTLTAKLNILFVANGALLTCLSISHLIVSPSLFGVAEIVGFFISFTLLVRAFLPRQMAVSPNLEDRKFLERYLALSPIEYQLQMLVNLSETYNARKQRIDDVSLALHYAAYTTWGIAAITLTHIAASYFTH